MAIQYKSKCVNILSRIILVCLISGRSMELQQISTDIEVRVGDSVLLNCSSNESSRILWLHNEDYVSHDVNVFAPYVERFSIQPYPAEGIHSLFIENVRPEDSGNYKCRIADIRWEDKPKNLIVLDSNPVCSSNMGSEGFIGPNTCNLEQDKKIFSCSVSFYGSTRPQLKWRLLSDSHVFNESECSYKNNRINCTLNRTADTAHDGSVFTCQTAKAIETQYSCNISNIRVQYFSLTNDSKKKKDVGQKVSCLVNTSQTVSFYWKLSHDDRDQIVSNDQSLVLQEPGLYRCDVEYNIKNRKCFTLVSSFYVQEGNKQVKIWAAVLSFITFLFFAIIALFVLYRLYKRKRKPQNVTYMNGESHPLIVTATTTSSDPTSNAIDSDGLCYTLKPSVVGHEARRGLCIIINNFKYPPESGLSERTGAGREIDNLRKLWEKLKFKVVIYENLIAEHMKDRLIFGQNEVDPADDAFVCCIMSHGENGEIFGVDGNKVSVMNLMKLFFDEFCPQLKGKPKLFFIGSCQGKGNESSDSKLLQHMSHPDGIASYAELIPSNNDFIVSYAALPDKVSWADRTSGGLYVDALVKVRHVNDGR